MAYEMKKTKLETFCSLMTDIETNFIKSDFILSI